MHKNRVLGLYSNEELRYYGKDKNIIRERVP